VNRREFLISAAALACWKQTPAFGEEPHHQEPPYLKLKTFIEPGNDEFAGEQAALQLKSRLHAALASKDLAGAAIGPASYKQIAPDLAEGVFAPSPTEWRVWVESLGSIRRAAFFPLAGDIVRFEVASEKNGALLYRVGLWRHDNGVLSPIEEHVASSAKPFFRDVTASVFAHAPAFHEQLRRGVPYWRSRLDPATGIDLYGSNGIAVGDIDGDGIDEVYICQPGGLPNKLLKFKEDGTVTDITSAWRADILDDSSCALFLDLRNSGRQDLVVLRSGGPLLLLNDGSHFRLRDDVFHFATLPQGGFTGMAAADFDRDGKLDLYLCCYVYFQSEAQYTYASPYHDAQNGPPNFLFRNKLNADGTGSFEDCTAESGLNQNNNRFSFAPAWCDFNEDGWPDLYVANDFGRKNLYVNQNGRFEDKASEAGVEDIGPGMSAAWFDFDGDGRADLYVANMWTDAGQRVVRDTHFAPGEKLPAAYRRHTMGNTLFRNRGDGVFDDATLQQQAGFGRWAWAADGHDLDNDGKPEIFVTCGMLTNESETDLNGFFWRQVVARSPVMAQPSAAYENGWNAINQFIREEYSWNGREPNVLHMKRGDRYFDFSGVSGLDFADDSRAFAVTDFDGDGRPDLILKSRLGPQVRVLQNDCAHGKNAIVIQLEGTKSNRDGIGAKVEIDGQAKWLSAGSGFLSQHSKKLIFGLGTQETAHHVRITWPSGATQELANLKTGQAYLITEADPHPASKPLRPTRPLPASAVQGDNTLRLEDTWLMEPVPLPEPQPGPGLFVLKDKRETFEIFRRYLFDWRTSLVTPFHLLLNKDGHAVKVYAEAPSSTQVRADLAKLGSPTPFAGFYVGNPHRDFFKFGAAYLWSGYYEQALPYLLAVLRRTPENARVLVLVGQIHLQANRLDQAEKYFRDGLAVNDHNPEAWAGLANTYEARKDFKDARDSYDKALDLKPDMASTLLNAGQLADKMEELKRAEDFYRRALELNPRQAEAANGLGLALAKQGIQPDAKKYFQQAISLKRDYADAINNLGVLYMQQGKTDDAVAAFEYGIQVAPLDETCYLNLGRIYTQLGKLERAKQLMQQLLDRKPDSATAKHALQELNGR
jgi:tetratricopeptide (TPR) repeat protein